MTNRRRVRISTDLSESMCFGCGQNNPIGLKLSFQWDGKTARTEFIPTEFHQAWPGIVHGGIITSMLDEAMAYACRFEGMNCVTGKMQIKFRRPAAIDGPLVIAGKVTRRGKKWVWTKGRISLPGGTLVAESTAAQFVIGTMPGDTSDKKGKSQSNVQR